MCNTVHGSCNLTRHSISSHCSVVRMLHVLIRGELYPKSCFGTEVEVSGRGQWEDEMWITIIWRALLL